MRRHRKAALSGALLVALVVGGLEGAAQMSPSRAVVTPGETASLVGARAPLFRVRGRVTGLYPGARTSLRARVSNPYGFPIVLKVVKATVTSPVDACPRAVVRVRPWRGKRVVKGHGSRVLRLRVSMKTSAPEACQGVKFVLRFTGKARKR